MPIDWSGLRNDELCNMCVSVKSFLLRTDGELLEICKKFLQMAQNECERRSPLLSQLIQILNQSTNNEVTA